MSKENKFGIGTIYRISEYMWYFMLSNFYFLLMNIPFMLALLNGYSSGYKSISTTMLLSMVLIGPAFVALLSVMGELVREKDVQVTKKFFKAYKSNFFEALFYWCFELGVLAIIYVDILFGKTKVELKLYNYFMLFAGLLIFSMSFYIFPIISRFHLRVKAVVRLSFTYSIKKIHITILNYVFLVGLILTQSKISILILFMWSLFCYLIMFYEKDILKEIQTDLEKNNNG